MPVLWGEFRFDPQNLLLLPDIVIENKAFAGQKKGAIRAR
jgi:hypothetical protein